jgi:hypothetical protein
MSSGLDAPEIRDIPPLPRMKTPGSGATVVGCDRKSDGLEYAALSRSMRPLFDAMDARQSNPQLRSRAWGD